MDNTYIAMAGSGTILVKPAKMRFGDLLDELESAEVAGRPPKLRLGAGRRSSKRGFERFCRRNDLHFAGRWQGVCVFIRPDFIWPA